MDIVSRLKTYINHLNIPVTQFADNCNIPRPTLSQLLNGRNKKVSDELIGKIHDTYPLLSVLWLMFGEGDMLHNRNIETSEAQNGSIFDLNNNEPAADEQTTPSIDFNRDFNETDSKNLKTQPTSHLHHSDKGFNATDLNSNKAIENNEKISANNTITFNADQSKKIVNIIVYYNDNSFESFVPNINK